MNDMRCGFPANRLRRLRGNPVLADSVRETILTVQNLMMPLFIVEGKGIREPLASLDGVDHLSVDRLEEVVDPALELGVRSFLLFGLPGKKDGRGSSGSDQDGPVQRALRHMSSGYGNQVLLASDVCMCQYTDHGHCGILKEDGSVDNDSTLKRLGEIAVSHGRAGAHMVAPSAMMDGQVGAIRSALDRSGFEGVSVMGYSAKFHSAMYGPFREAANSAPGKGDRSTYQMDPANGREAIREALQDEQEGADLLMVKPSLLYLDVLANLRRETLLPLAAYMVSGEYMMLRHGARAGAIDGKRSMMEAHLALKRAGADIIITYGAREIARWLSQP
ncbi:porphobilinogen synthase [Dethiosulfovibrio salsuginis]|uniref:Delta-aminolevulinic acid dehydratase n=2 Tax=Dethiosulfovibrio salsuginis TaxID=561720 RepID=A0A1X7KEX0_9BACT|nr:porphobilinogen synthase [Dethiosulfovibrio salsuginis]